MVDWDFQIQTDPPRTPLIENLFAEKSLAKLWGTPSLPINGKSPMFDIKQSKRAEIRVVGPKIPIFSDL